MREELPVLQRLGPVPLVHALPHLFPREPGKLGDLLLGCKVGQLGLASEDAEGEQEELARCQAVGVDSKGVLTLVWS
jgi:hypothetical protein